MRSHFFFFLVTVMHPLFFSAEAIVLMVLAYTLEPLMHLNREKSQYVAQGDATL